MTVVCGSSLAGYHAQGPDAQQPYVWSDIVCEVAVSEGPGAVTDYTLALTHGQPWPAGQSWGDSPDV